VAYIMKETDSLVGRRVEFQVDHAAFGIGLVIEHDIESGRITVCDEDDSSLWKGYDYQLA